MDLYIKIPVIPGTTIPCESMDFVSGTKFLDNIFFITDGIMLGQVRDITGVDGSTLQNWVKRRWVANPQNKRYSKEHLARILLINMMRGSMQLERIDYLLRYLNVSAKTNESAVITDSRLYGYVCDVIEKLSLDDGTQNNRDTLYMYINESISDFTEPIIGATERLRKSIEIIVTAYYASKIQEFSNMLYERL